MGGVAVTVPHVRIGQSDQKLFVLPLENLSSRSVNRQSLGIPVQALVYVALVEGDFRFQQRLIERQERRPALVGSLQSVVWTPKVKQYVDLPYERPCALDSIAILSENLAGFVVCGQRILQMPHQMQGLSLRPHAQSETGGVVQQITDNQRAFGDPQGAGRLRSNGLICHCLHLAYHRRVQQRGLALNETALFRRLSDAHELLDQGISHTHNLYFTYRVRGRNEPGTWGE